MRRVDMDKYTAVIRDIWRMIWRQMDERAIDPVQLAAATPYSLEHIERGIAGEVIPVTLPFLRACVVALGIVESGRTHVRDRYTKREDSLSYDECLELLASSRAIPPRQRHFGDWE